ncbi:MAG: DsbA family protein [Acidobacteria bacterium]|nr:DsbA family protein [Acidobacteriota bacterium]MCH8128674.1 DsbA family protein [Acidobacteriota bacterium]
MPDLELIYVGDPMCSWCYGFGPVVENLDARFSFPTRLIIGGLRPGPAAEVLDDRMRRFLRHHWEEIGERTGQPFDLSGLDRENWAYDTMTADTAAVTMREIDADVALAFFARLQRAFYAERVDVTDPAVYRELVADFAVGADRFADQLASPAMREETLADFAEARALGATGFPTLYLGHGDDIYLVSRGYAPFEVLEEALIGFLDERFPEEIGDLVRQPAAAD